MDVNTLLWWSNGLTFDSSVIALNDFLNDIGGVLDGIKSPGLLDSGDFLLHGSKETLWVEETGEPVGWWALLGDPVVELVVSIQETLDPTSEGWSHPRDFCTSWIELELTWDSEIKDGTNGVNDVWSHDNGTLNGIDHVLHGGSDDGQDHLESIDLLSEEDIQWNSLWVTNTSWSLKMLQSFIYIK